MERKRIQYKGFLIEYGDFYSSGNKWYTWNDLHPTISIMIDESRNGFETLEAAKTAIDEYKKNQ